jgi:hypothetical protein
MRVCYVSGSEGIEGSLLTPNWHKAFQSITYITVSYNNMYIYILIK